MAKVKLEQIYSIFNNYLASESTDFADFLSNEGFSVVSNGKFEFSEKASSVEPKNLNYSTNAKKFAEFLPFLAFVKEQHLIDSTDADAASQTAENILTYFLNKKSGLAMNKEDAKYVADTLNIGEGFVKLQKSHLVRDFFLKKIVFPVGSGLAIGLGAGLAIGLAGLIVGTVPFIGGSLGLSLITYMATGSLAGGVLSAVITNVKDLIVKRANKKKLNAKLTYKTLFKDLQNGNELDSDLLNSLTVKKFLDSFEINEAKMMDAKMNSKLHRHALFKRLGTRNKLHTLYDFVTDLETKIATGKALQNSESPKKILKYLFPKRKDRKNYSSCTEEQINEMLNVAIGREKNLLDYINAELHADEIENFKVYKSGKDKVLRNIDIRLRQKEHLNTKERNIEAKKFAKNVLTQVMLADVNDETDTGIGGHIQKLSDGRTKKLDLKNSKKETKQEEKKIKQEGKKSKQDDKKNNVSKEEEKVIKAALKAERKAKKNAEVERKAAEAENVEKDTVDQIEVENAKSPESKHKIPLFARIADKLHKNSSAQQTSSNNQSAPISNAEEENRRNREMLLGKEPSYEEFMASRRRLDEIDQERANRKVVANQQEDNLTAESAQETAIPSNNESVEIPNDEEENRRIKAMLFGRISYEDFMAKQQRLVEIDQERAKRRNVEPAMPVEQEEMHEETFVLPTAEPEENFEETSTAQAEEEARLKAEEKARLDAEAKAKAEADAKAAAEAKAEADKKLLIAMAEREAEEAKRKAAEAEREAAEKELNAAKGRQKFDLSTLTAVQDAYRQARANVALAQKTVNRLLNECEDLKQQLKLISASTSEEDVKTKNSLTRKLKNKNEKLTEANKILNERIQIANDLKQQIEESNTSSNNKGI